MITAHVVLLPWLFEPYGGPAVKLMVVEVVEELEASSGWEILLIISASSQEKGAESSYTLQAWCSYGKTNVI